MAGKTQVIGGSFQDLQGNVLANGYLIWQLVQDEQLSSSQGQVGAGIISKTPLDINGNVQGTPSDGGAPQYVWPTDQMNPSGATYTVTGYTSAGQRAWGPNYGLQVPSSPNPYNLDNWVPNSTGTGSSGGGSSLLLQTNGVNNGDQQKLNLFSGDSSVTLVDDGNGNISLEASGGGGTKVASPQWWMTDGSDGSLAYFQLAEEAVISVANQIYFLKVNWITDRNFTKWTFVANTSSGGGGNFIFGIYDSTGTLVYSPSAAVHVPNGSFLEHSQTVSQVKINAGTYYIGFSSDDIRLACYGWIDPRWSPLSGSIGSGFANFNSVRMGTAANTASGLAMPSTLGALTAYNGTDAISIPWILFEN